MKKFTDVIWLRILIIILVQFVCVGLWCLIFEILIGVSKDFNEMSSLLLWFDLGVFIGIVVLNNCLAKYFRNEKDFSKFFFGKKISKKEACSIVNRTYKKMKPIIVIAHLVVIILFNLACEILKFSNEKIDALNLPFSADELCRLFFRVIGTISFICFMIKYCKSSFNISLTICPSCGKVTEYSKERIKTLIESWTETSYRTRSYTTTEKIGEIRDSDGNSCDVYGDVEHCEDDSRDIYHPGLHEYKYECVLCGYSYTRTEKR